MLSGAAEPRREQHMVKSGTINSDHHYDETQRNAERQKSQNTPTYFIKSQRGTVFDTYLLVFT